MPNLLLENVTRPTSLEEKLAQLIMIRIGSNLPPILRVHEDEDRVAKQLEACPVGGLMLFNGVWPSAKKTLDQLQASSKVPMLVASDIERGTGQQVAGLTLFPHQRAFVDLDDCEAAITRFCQRTAQEAHATGIHITFGPVADTNTNPRNPIIATRAFGNDPEVAAKLSACYVKAAEEAGLLSTAKHFPGHGDTQQDSHDAMPIVEHSLEELNHRELVPFRASIEAGCSLIMTAHVEYPALDPSGTPATLSKPILIDFLRGELGFKGVVTSDSLLMAGVRDRFETEGELAVATLNAGVDLLLDIEDPVAAVEAMVAAVEKGELSVERVDEALDRIWKLKERSFAASKAVKAPADNAADASADDAADNAADNAVDIKAGHAEAIAIATAATKIVDQTDRVALPLDSKKPLTALLLKPHHRPTDPPEQPLAAALREQIEELDYFETGPEPTADFVQQVLDATPEQDPILIAMVVKPAAWHAFGLVASQEQIIRQLMSSRAVVLVCLGVENALEDYPEAAIRIVTHSDVPASQQALAQLLYSEAQFGK